jgi:proline dehydrogenase
MLRTLLSTGNYPAIATHDQAMIERARRWASEQGIGRDRFEFQMLYGIHRSVQAALARDGYRMRVYVPFGREWFPYFMRRLGERPANVLFVLRSLASG